MSFCRSTLRTLDGFSDQFFTSFLVILKKRHLGEGRIAGELVCRIFGGNFLVELPSRAESDRKLRWMVVAGYLGPLLVVDLGEFHLDLPCKGSSALRERACGHSTYIVLHEGHFWHDPICVRILFSRGQSDAKGERSHQHHRRCPHV